MSFKIALLCGGPSLERGISLNSARSVCDHLRGDGIEVVPVYFDHRKNAHLISRAQLYSNTPSDFDFKLQTHAQPLSKAQLIHLLKSCRLAFPAIHGPFGEDGEIQSFLEKNGIPFVGSGSKACLKAFDKFDANRFIASQGFFTIPSLLLKKGSGTLSRDIGAFFKKHRLRRAIVKPATGGSSIAVYSVGTAKEALKAAETILKSVGTRAVLEPFCHGKEFTVILLENKEGKPVAILPTEIELSYDDHQIFDYRKKYLATRHVRYHCPPRFADATVEKIRTQAQQLFKLLGLRDFARFDGWLFADGTLYFSDFNPVSGMEQNSFLFQQSSQIGMSHGDLLRFVLKSACRRQRLTLPQKSAGTLKNRQPIHVLFGGNTAERQVSLMSGTNVWLKLRKSQLFDPRPFLLDTRHDVWRLPYAMTLNHTVEEIMETCRNAKKDEARLHALKEKVLKSLKADPDGITEPWFAPEKMTLREFIQKSPYVFIGLHGGIGENGALQKTLEKAGVPFNGSGSKASHLCMNKFETGQALGSFEKEGIHTAPKLLVELAKAPPWASLIKALGSKSIVVKPNDDGCSAGIARLYSASDLKKYLEYAQKSSSAIPPGTLTHQHGMIEMPSQKMKHLLFEAFIETDRVNVMGSTLHWKSVTDWIEITMGLLEKNGKLHALHPSITVASGNILSLEEKFQGGTGVNITPPPAPWVSPEALKKAMRRMEKVAGALGIKNYARIDAFMHRRTGELIIIEANTVPGLTPSTVIYHQALAETPPLYPREFLEAIVTESFKK